MTEWRIINEGEFSEAQHHALDEILTRKIDNQEMKPTLRFWYRENSSVPLGRFQSYQDEVEHDYITENNIEVVRRITGGGAMFAEPGNVITYSMYMPREKVPRNIENSYRTLDSWAIKALKDLGVEAHYQPLNDIESPKGKLGGAAQLRKNNAVLHHTMISYDLNLEKMLKALRIGKAKLSDKAISSAEKRVSRVSDHTHHDREDVVSCLIEKFKESHEAYEGSLSQEEINQGKELASKKFEKNEWTKKIK